MHLGMTGRFTVVRQEARQIPSRGRRGREARPCRVRNAGRGDASPSTMRGVSASWTSGRWTSSTAIRRSTGWAPSRSRTSSRRAYLEEAFEGKKTPVKAALLDQRVVAGLGNIYVSEALFRSGINPKKLAGRDQARQAREARRRGAQRDRGGDRSRRLDDQRLRNAGWRARLFPAPLPRLRPRRQALCRLRQADQADGAVGAVDVLLRELPEVAGGLTALSAFIAARRRRAGRHVARDGEKPHAALFQRQARAGVGQKAPDQFSGLVRGGEDAVEAFVDRLCPSDRAYAPSDSAIERSAGPRNRASMPVGPAIARHCRAPRASRSWRTQASPHWRRADSPSGRRCRPAWWRGAGPSCVRRRAGISRPPRRRGRRRRC